ncbi:MAG: hypothetical protein CMF60_08670 [Magnetococcales bacterium]|nr:hypothetical protein [Magnetococcales bacterium]MEC8067128.1 DUF6088 family protein [Pseudomonadota bacterium]
MSALQSFKRHLKPGNVYRREDLVAFSNAVDRHLQELVLEGFLSKIETGLYYRPKQSDFGPVPPGEEELVKAFLKDDDFLIMSLNNYNSLGLGTTQLYNTKVVYNRKRDGKITLNKRQYYFMKNRKYPRKESLEFLLVDVVNNLKLLAENQDKLLQKVVKKMASMDKRKLMKAVNEYGNVKAQKFFKQALSEKGYISSPKQSAKNNKI